MRTTLISMEPQLYMPDLFSGASDTTNQFQNHYTKSQLNAAPLAARMRPETFDEFIGQSHILGETKLLKRAVISDRFSSLIFYGPPGCGKTTLAKIISCTTKSIFISLNAVSSNVQELRKVIEQAEANHKLSERKTILFIDEIHRFNKAQQDVLMPYVESGILILIGSTTHNPSFSINGPLLSRSLVFELKPLEEADVMRILQHALGDCVRGLGKQKIHAKEDALQFIAKCSAGDARRALNALEVAALTTGVNQNGEIVIDLEVAKESCQRKVVYYDRDEDYHYDTASAFIKSMRGSDVDSAIYWLAKMIYAGEDPRFIARRIVILAAEDIGNADPQALVMASAGLQAVEFVGMPEARIILSQLVAYMALAPKSNASYMAIESATQDVVRDLTEEVPAHLRDASYKGAKKMGHGQGYQYAHHFPGHVVSQDYRSAKNTYYHPTNHGFERELAERLREIKKTLSKES